jgi:hypothetical protein
MNVSNIRELYVQHYGDQQPKSLEALKNDLRALEKRGVDEATVAAALAALSGANIWDEVRGAIASGTAARVRGGEQIGGKVAEGQTTAQHAAVHGLVRGQVPQRLPILDSLTPTLREPMQKITELLQAARDKRLTGPGAELLVKAVLSLPASERPAVIATLRDIVADQQTFDRAVRKFASSAAKRDERATLLDKMLPKLLEDLEAKGIEVRGGKLTVAGYGVLGSRVADELRKRGAEVTIYIADREREAERLEQAQRDGFAVTNDRDQAASRPLIDATGGHAIRPDDLAKLAGNAVIASTSTKNLSIPLRSGRTDGFPVNFTGNETLPESAIQLTQSLMWQALLNDVPARDVQPLKLDSEARKQLRRLMSDEK